MLPTSLCDSITLVNNKHSHTSRNQEENQVNIPTVRTKTSGSNIIKSKSANIWNYLKLFNNRLDNLWEHDGVMFDPDVDVYATTSSRLTRYVRIDAQN